MNNESPHDSQNNLDLQPQELAALTKFAEDNQVDANEILAQIKNQHIRNKCLSCLSLTDLKISNLTALQDLSELECLRIHFSEDLKELPDFSSFKAQHKLKELTFVACPNLSDVSALSAVSNLKELSLLDCNITNLNFLIHLEALDKLNLHLSASEEKVDLAPIAELKKLVSLYIFKSPDMGVVNIEQIASLAELKQVRLSFHLLPHELKVLDGLPALEDLSTGFVDEVETLRPLLQHRKLESLHFFAYGVTSLAGIEVLANLRSLSLFSYRISDFSPLAQIENLRKLRISGATQEADWQSLTKLKQIKELEIYGCQELSDISFLKAMPWLESASVKFCKGVENLEVLEMLEGVNVKSVGNAMGAEDSLPN